MSSLVLRSPFSGWSAPLDEAPDPVFAGRMLGDGVAIDPTGGTLHAPCDGEVVAIPQTRHAVTLRAACGAEILMHIGIDTVALAGVGFEAHVKAGDRVRAGERLITFDMDLIARRAKSLMTPILLVDGGGFAVLERTVGRAVELGEILLTLTPVTAPGSSAPSAAAAPPAAPPAAMASGSDPQRTSSRRVRIAWEHGIHARPAARLARSLAPFDAQVMLRAGGREANARSTVALMALGVRHGEEIEIRAAGPEALAAVAALESVLREGADAAAAGGSGRRPRVAPLAGAPAASPTVPARASEAAPCAPRSQSLLRGVSASRGVAVGRARWLKSERIEVLETGAGVAHERAALGRARALVQERIEQAAGGVAGPAREILEAHRSLLDDPEVIERAESRIEDGAGAAFAWRQAIRSSVAELRSLGDPRMAERAADLLDLEEQVLLALAGAPAAAACELAADTILLAEELLPSQLISLDAAKLAGFALAAGGATSHVSILAAAMGIPALVALGTALAPIADGTALILDADEGVLVVDPQSERLRAVRGKLEIERRRRAEERAAAQRECRTADGVRIGILANLGSLAEAQAAIANGAEGCGLLRTEFLFLDRQTPPSETEQREEYQRIAAALAGRPLTIRTLDAGGDKPIPYLPLPREENPALGLRGIRTSLQSPELLRAQLRAVLAVHPVGQCRILLPMITDAAEIRTVRALTAQLCRELGRLEPIELGVMVETPAAALMAESLCAEADFFSIGTNDLTQYTLAMDRGHAQLAARLDGLHPAVLRLIGRTAESARARGRAVAVCGGLASDPAAAPILIGLGVHELSAVPSVIPRLKALIGAMTLEDCERLAREALQQESAEAVRRLASP